LRRASPITHYAAAALLEAVAALPGTAGSRPRLGVVMCLNAGCVLYSCRFWAEVLQDATTASPLLFPETVFSAPVSHICALQDSTPLVCTLIGDPATYLQGLAVAIDWLEEGRVDACVVVGAEELNWLLGDAVWHLERGSVLCGGAGALCVSLNPGWSMGVALEAITGVHTYAGTTRRQAAARAMRRELPAMRPGEVLCDGVGDSAGANAAELAAWRDWCGPRLRPKQILGEGLMAAAAWQCVAGIEAVAAGEFEAANISLVGGTQQAIGARFAASQPVGGNTDTL
jgi:hypothetical protein